MNKLTKVGLTALAGSLAAVAGANAGSLTVSGGSDITWLSKTGNTTSSTDANTGNPIGWKNNITFGASGELDNGISWSANAYNSDAQALTSSNITFDLGGMGSLLIDNGAGGAGLDALDDKMPTAWEETHGTGINSGAVTVSVEYTEMLPLLIPYLQTQCLRALKSDLDTLQELMAVDYKQTWVHQEC